jgi:hypothetical protein
MPDPGVLKQSPLAQFTVSDRFLHFVKSRRRASGFFLSTTRPADR